MKDKIYVHIGHHLGLMQASSLPTSAPGEEEFIRKKALLEWAKNWEKIGVSNDFAYAIETLIKHINSL